MKKVFAMALLGLALAAFLEMPVQAEGKKEGAAKGVAVLVWPQVDEGFSIMLKNPEATLVHDEIMKRINVDLKPVYYPLDQYNNRVSMLLASGDQVDALPRLGMEKAIQYYLDGVTIDLSNLIRQYGPNIVSTLEKDASFRQAREESMFQGKDILIPSSIGFLRGDTIQIRTDWLKKLGMNMPATLEDFVAYMKAVKTGDPDGNGKDDAYGLSLSIWGASFQRYLTNYYCPSGNNWYLDAAGKLQPPEVHPNYQAMLADLVQWYKAGYLPPEVFISKDDQRLDWITSNKVGALAAWYSSAIAGTLTLKEKVPDAAFVPFNMTGKPEAANAYTNQRAMANSNSITKSSKNPEAAMRFYDFMFTKDGMTLVQYGIEGKSFRIIEAMPDSILKEDKTKLYYAAFLPQTGGPAPFGLFAGVAANLVLYRDLIKATTAIKGFDAPDKLINYDTKKFSVADKLTDLNTFLDEQRLKVLVGEIPASQWGDIMAKWKSMGGDALINEKNVQYQAWKKAR